MKMKRLKKYIYTLTVFGCVMWNTTTTCFASGEDSTASPDASSVVAPIFTIINIFVVALQAVGAFIFIKSLSELAVSIQREDNVGMASAVKGMIAGVMLISIRLLLKLCGVQLG